MKISPIMNYNRQHLNQYSPGFMAKGIYPGSFDPITNGHIDIIKRAGGMFDSLTVLVAKNPEKNDFLPVEQRITLIKKALDFEGLKNVFVDSCTGLSVAYAKEHGCEYMVRGIRDSKDFEYEKELYRINKVLDSSIDTVYIPAKPEFENISSSLVRKLYQAGTNIANFVPKSVLNFLSQTSDKQCIETHLTTIMKKLGADNKFIKQINNEVIDAYSRENRGYHDTKHIETMLKQLDIFMANSKEANKVKNLDELRLAIIFHDYVNGEPDEINKSIAYAQKVLKTINPEYDTSNLVNLISATDHSLIKANGSFDEKLIHDLDLVILGQSDNEYNEYVKQIRAQYSQYSDFEFNKARLEVLKKLIYQPKVYKTEYFSDRFGNKALVNMLNEKEQLLKH